MKANTGTWGSNLKAGTKETIEECGLLFIYKSLDWALTEDHLPKGGTTYSNLDPSTSIINQENALRACPYALWQKEKVFPDKTPTRIEILELELLSGCKPPHLSARK